jgi:hypothetical protein
MKTWTVLAAKHAAVASGLGVGAGVVPALGTGSVDGFLAGALMTGACCAAMSGQGRARLRHRAVVMAGLGSGWNEGRRGRRGRDANPAETPARRADEAEQPTAEETSGYRSRHRLTEDTPSRPRSESRRSAPRHAAPPVSFGDKMSGRRFTLRLLAPARH